MSRLVTPLLWLIVLAAALAALLFHRYGQTPAGGYARGAWGLVFAVTLALVLCVFVAIQGLIHRRLRTRWAGSGASCPPAEGPDWPGFRASCGGLGLVLVLLACYHLAVGFDVHPPGRRAAAILLMGALGGCGAALLVLADRRWSANLADVGMAQLCLAACCGAVAVLPSEPVALERRYPLIFNAILIALAVMTWLWCWLGRVWRQQLDGGTAWTTAGRMIEPAGRVSFFSGLTALVVAWLMAVWPRLPAVSTMDHSLGRIAAGVAGHLLLLWALLWSARRTRRLFFTSLALLAVASLLAFVYARTAPLATRTL